MLVQTCLCIRPHPICPPVTPQEPSQSGAQALLHPLHPVHSAVAQSLSPVRLFAAPWTVRLLGPCDSPGKEYWSGLPFPPPGDLSDPGIEPVSPALPVDSLPAEPSGKPKYTYVLLAHSRYSIIRKCDSVSIHTTHTHTHTHTLQLLPTRRHI